MQILACASPASCGRYTDISVVPLLVPTVEGIVPVGSQQTNPGREQEIVILFCDIRSFTMLTEAQLPYDIVFLLNRYFAIVGQAVETSGGRWTNSSAMVPWHCSA